MERVAFAHAGRSCAALWTACKDPNHKKPINCDVLAMWQRFPWVKLFLCAQLIRQQVTQPRFPDKFDALLAVELLNASQIGLAEAARRPVWKGLSAQRVRHEHYPEKSISLPR